MTPEACYFGRLQEAITSFAMLVPLGLATAVFVEGAQRIVKKDKDAELLRSVCKAFGSVDDDGTMDVSYDEFMSHLCDNSLDVFFHSQAASRKLVHVLGCRQQCDPLCR